ncbi:NAD(P)-dependent oxidoreductase [Solirubrobacter sp. CPCC 204708]|uniref:NAD(P)-binding domain-containing protein n=1 Tax=Solirubrobacter deserti TaxID=2282478 RepID=A0ABT4RR63_9ACTN|nr:NAD(P)-binding domain-containing protein [Solirubrobacter deserti]MBE2320520.1 NAD(P)-dependent oxidoreductase [Solirubrobacter deserti]MDA0140766.1 NAD(P)-binding domain-containing protein [Solirubrobacter deserti]
MTEHKPAVTVIGLGAMGSALASTLVAAGHPTTVWNRTPRTVEGATAAASVADAIAASPLTLVCVAGADVAEDLLAGAGDLTGRTIVNFTTTTTASTSAAGERVGAQGGTYIDGAILAVPPAIGTETALLFVSGGAPAALETLGTVMEVADASLWDLALLSGMYGMVGGALQAFALVRAAGGTATELSGLLASFVAEMAGDLPGMAERVEAGEHPTASPLAMQAAGVKLTDVAREYGVRADLMAPIEALIAEGVAAGHGDEDLSALVELLREPVAA